MAVSGEDRRRFGRLAPGAPFAVVPNGVDTHTFRPASVPQAGVVFVGGYSWYPNRDALAHFAEDVLPLLRAQVPGVQVRWVGRAPDEVRREYRERHGMELTGYVEDIRPSVHQAACYVVPLRVGGGTRLKILDAWAMGKAVVSTSVGCEGLDARDGENILVRDDPAEFAAAVRRVLEDDALRARLGEAARRTAEEVYEWEVIGRSMAGTTWRFSAVDRPRRSRFRPWRRRGPERLRTAGLGVPPAGPGVGLRLRRRANNARQRSRAPAETAPPGLAPSGRHPSRASCAPVRDRGGGAFCAAWPGPWCRCGLRGSPFLRPAVAPPPRMGRPGCARWGRHVLRGRSTAGGARTPYGASFPRRCQGRGLRAPPSRSRHGS